MSKTQDNARRRALAWNPPPWKMGTSTRLYGGEAVDVFMVYCSQGRQIHAARRDVTAEDTWRLIVDAVNAFTVEPVEAEHGTQV